MKEAAILKVYKALGKVIFFSRWLQAPIYFGLIVVQFLYVYEFVRELFQLVTNIRQMSESQLMMSVLGLIDVVMVANLLVMVIVGGYDVFVSRVRIGQHPDKPEWLDHVNAGTMKIKLAVSLIGISSIHLLQTFMSPEKTSTEMIMWKVIIHLTFVVSALLMAYTDRMITTTRNQSRVSSEP